jgi:hypothetical protein
MFRVLSVLLLGLSYGYKAMFNASNALLWSHFQPFSAVQLSSCMHQSSRQYLHVVPNQKDNYATSTAKFLP